jgi:hypothetical protein
MGPDPERLSVGQQHRLRDVVADRLSRRQLLHRGAVVLGGLAGARLFEPTLALGAAVAAPRPIPGGLDQSFMPVASNPLVHVLPPGIGFEMSTITDFNGVLGGSEIRGSAHDSDGVAYDFDTDLRFMRGVYVGLDGRKHHGTFGFI